MLFCFHDFIVNEHLCIIAKKVIGVNRKKVLIIMIRTFEFVRIYSTDLAIRSSNAFKNA